MEGWLCQVMEELNFQVQDFRLTGRHMVLIAVSWGRHCFRRVSLVMVNGLGWRREILERGRSYKG